jgi:META domain
VTANEKLTFQQGQSAGCPKTDALRKAVLSGTPTIKAGRSGTFTLKSGGQTLTLMPSGNPDFGALFNSIVIWSITSWKEVDKLPRASTGSLRTSGTSLTFGDGCNGISGQFVAANGKFSMSRNRSQTAMACPGYKPSDESEWAKTPIYDYKILSKTSFELSSKDLVITLER